MKIRPTVARQAIALTPTDHPFGSYDISLESPDQQFQALTDMLEAADAASPSPYTGTPPWGEPTPIEEYPSDSLMEENYMPYPDIDAQADVELLSVISDAPTSDIPEWNWYNDDQYHGLGVPPGVPNWGQPVESGHSQITLPNPAAGYREFEWSGKPVARVARHENNFPGYSAGTNRGHGVVPIKLYMPYVLRTQQMRDLLLAELNKRGLHNVVVSDVPSFSYTEQVAVVDPSVLAPQVIPGPEGWLP